MRFFVRIRKPQSFPATNTINTNRITARWAFPHRIEINATTRTLRFFNKAEQIDEVKVYDYPLDAYQVSALYALGGSTDTDTDVGDGDDEVDTGGGTSSAFH